MRAACGRRGQASVEFVAAAGVVVACALVAWQLAVAGHALWMSANAARAGARAELVGRDPVRAALGALPPAMRRRARVAREGREVRVSVRVPLLTGGSGPRVSASAGPPGPR